MKKLTLNNLLGIIIVILLSVVLFRLEFAITQIGETKYFAEDASVEAAKAAVYAEGADMKAGEAASYAAGSFANTTEE